MRQGMESGERGFDREKRKERITLLPITPLGLSVKTMRDDDTGTIPLGGMDSLDRGSSGTSTQN